MKNFQIYTFYHTFYSSSSTSKNFIKIQIKLSYPTIIIIHKSIDQVLIKFSNQIFSTTQLFERKKQLRTSRKNKNVKNVINSPTIIKLTKIRLKNKLQIFSFHISHNIVALMGKYSFLHILLYSYSQVFQSITQFKTLRTQKTYFIQRINVFKPPL